MYYIFPFNFYFNKLSHWDSFGFIFALGGGCVCSTGDLLTSTPLLTLQEQLSLEKASITAELAVSEKLLNDQLESSRKIQEDLKDLSASLEKERAERVNILLKNAEISQSEESLKQDLKLERDEVEELLEQVKLLQRDVSIHEENERRLMMELDATTIKIQDKENLDKELQHLSQDLIEKNKVRDL